MTFETIFKSLLSENECFLKSVFVQKYTNENIEMFFVNIRTFLKKDNNEYATKNGVILRASEFKDVIECFGDKFQNPSFTIEKSNRKIEFKQGDRPYIFEFVLTKENGCIQRVLMIEKEIQALINIKQEILTKIQLDESRINMCIQTN